MEHASQNPSADSVTGMPFNLPRSISQEQSHAYKKKTNAPAIMERASVAAYIFPFAAMVRPSVASAMDGAAPNNPANFLASARRLKLRMRKPRLLRLQIVK